MKHIAIIGRGKMGSAIEGRLAHDYTVTAIGRGELRQVEEVDTVILAVKPQAFGAVAENLWPHVHRQLFLSIMAGVTTTRLGRMLGTDQVVRTMPNLALTTGNSMTAWYAEDAVIDIEAVQDLLHKWGKSTRLTSETQFDAFTALAGSGPGYIYEFMRLLERQAEASGFASDQARQIAVQTLIGTASLVNAETDFGEMVQRVASKGGTTEAALDVFAQHNLAGTVEAAVGAACCRSRELGQ